MAEYSLIGAILLAVFAMTSFAKCVTVFSILRLGLGIAGAGVGAVVVILSLVLACFTASPQLTSAIDTERLKSLSLREQITQLEDSFSSFLLRHSDNGVREGLYVAHKELHADEPRSASASPNTAGEGGADTVSPASTQAPQTSDRPFLLLTLSFLLTELGEAFKIGILILVPFLIVDLVSMNVFTALGMGYSHHVVALPAKLLLFYVINGWYLVTEKLLFSYRG
jgi:type III secretion protein R